MAFVGANAREVNGVPGENQLVSTTRVQHRGVRVPFYVEYCVLVTLAHSKVINLVRKYVPNQQKPISARRHQEITAR
jgi:hypothetical protein